jgi:surface antigen
MRMIAILAVSLACVACQSDPNEGQTAMSPGDKTQADCRSFTAPVTTGGKPEQASGQVCQHPDGSWRVVQNTPGLPPQDYVVPPPGQPAVGASTAAPPPANQSPCSTFTVAVTIGDRQQEAVVESCQQPDGSWRITQNTPGLPQQVYVVPPPPPEYSYPYLAYPYADPYWFASPWFFGLGPTIFVAQRFPHFHHRFGRGFRPGFGHGSGRGLQRAGAGGRHR